MTDGVSASYDEAEHYKALCIRFSEHAKIDWRGFVEDENHYRALRERAFKKYLSKNETSPS